MKKSLLVCLCLLGISIISLSGCDKNNNNNSSNIIQRDYGNFSYNNELSNSYYTYDAEFENGTLKKYMLNESVNASVNGNCLILGVGFDRYIIDEENNILTCYSKQDSYYYSDKHYYRDSKLYKEVVSVLDGCLDYFINENFSDYIKVDYEISDFKYSYLINFYMFDDGWKLNRYNTKTYEYDEKGNFRALTKEEYSLLQEDLSPSYYQKEETIYFYDENNRIINTLLQKSDKFVIWMEENTEYSYDEKGNVVDIKVSNRNSPFLDDNSEWVLTSDNKFEYDSNNRITLETMEYSKYSKDKRSQQLSWVSTRDFNYKSEYTYNDEKLVKMRKTVYDWELGGKISYIEEIKYDENGYQENRYDDSGIKVKTFDLNNNLLSVAEYSQNRLLRLTEYTYDENNNLISVEKKLNDDLELVLDSKIENIYDLYGNLLYSIEYEREDGKLLKTGFCSYYYDSNGFMIKEEEFGRKGESKKFSKRYFYELSFDGTEYKTLVEKVYF